MKHLLPGSQARGEWFSGFVLLLGFAFSAMAGPYGLDSRPAIGPFLNGTMPETAPGISGDWSAVVAFPNLLFTNSVGLTFVPGSDQLCVWEREGRVWTFENDPGTTQKKLVLDLSNQCQGWDDSGLLGVAFHPGFATNHYVFVYYTWCPPGMVGGSPTTRPPSIGNYHDRLERYTLDDQGVAIPGSRTILIDLADQTVWHHGGGMFFHPKSGFLYLTIGDNSVGDNDQVINKSLYGGVLRLDVDCRGGAISHPIPRQPLNGHSANYFIPNDNPFVGQSNVLEEFFCLGLRSPHRMTYDPPTGRIFIGDVGESAREEVDVIQPGESGLNFQWPYCEGTLGKMPATCIGISRGPLLDYPHTDGRAVIGGYVYRGKKFAADLGGKYIFGDNVMRIVWAMDETTTPVRKNLLCVMPKGAGPNSGSDYTGLSSFGLDAAGEIYFCQMSSIGGRIFTLARGGPPPPTHPFPKLLSETGAFRELARLTPDPALVPYSVNTPLWSDGAVKTRWLALPAGTTIHFAHNGEWMFPPGTVFVKNFDLPVDDTNPKILRRLETRLLVRDTNDTVYGATYKWRPDLSDADLVTAGINENIIIKTAEGTRTQRWFYPGRQDCLTCHTHASGGVLGVKTRQLNGDFKYPNGVTDNQLRAWNHIGLFDTPLDESAIPRLAKLVAVTDQSASLELRTRSYLDANCAQCHRPGGVEAFFDARFDTPLAKQAILNGPVANPLGIPGAKIVVPGSTAKSVLLHRISILGDLQMPPLARNRVDQPAVSTIAEWINSLSPIAPSLPPGWTNADIGSVGLTGDASFLNDRFNLIASGTDIWGTADGCHFAATSLTGDGQIIARVVSMQYTDPWAKAGVMVRENFSSGAKDALMVITAGGSSAFQRRLQTGGLTWNTDGPPAVVPYWVRLVRAGDRFTGYVSKDGHDWKAVDSIEVPMSRTVYVGLTVTAHNNSELNSALLDHVTLTP
ncbi:MAG TPA: PQQ-dependent sugar dehydrogenase [Candidatus Acidoferrales bacterium]|nr:PQQ-dependent sugar dehydrogenase [Candidatus Acidoferrales bacterium]